MDEIILNNKCHILQLLNTGALSIESADWYERQGYSIIFKNGIAIDMIREEE